MENMENMEVVEVVDEPIEGEVVNTEETEETYEGEQHPVRDAAAAAVIAGVFVVGVVETTKHVIKAGKWIGGKVKELGGKAKDKWKARKAAKQQETVEDVAEVEGEPEKA